MITTLLAYLMIGGFFLIDHYARQGSQARSLERGEYDRGSTTLVSAAFLVSALALLAAPFLNHFHEGCLPGWAGVGWVGVGLMGLSLLLRLWANTTLGGFYTRTLRVADGQPIVQSGPYRVIRHPGYLGVILMWLGGGLAVMNWLATLAVLVSLLPAYHYRIGVEEAMLAAAQGEAYRAYQTHTWRLIPFIY